jgi:hypothetical protein
MGMVEGWKRRRFPARSERTKIKITPQVLVRFGLVLVWFRQGKASAALSITDTDGQETGRGWLQTGCLELELLKHVGVIGGSNQPFTTPNCTQLITQFASLVPAIK